ncbi:branched-chain amino acid ABC transporter permease [Alicyclobacillus cycloheptanicus]|uniref:Branched-chain amino acid transport system permease protein n=1 Tax=Alicyclobacillus cycloheptanicus TaxID=1457 RepID=A0ABT9XI19_9BACL|nr:branched-chain amino acid ABC transporter permease [Alicyclobacillus cycloheptanicus]MDQ0189951.1 branched-chain amino acid transport system permease protein [Alicyclobacillus cycloheptanicus]WDM02153.1 branched-chain amino acid ABC transporter permease [Alicyclobacillus cycloheptanicus]
MHQQNAAEPVQTELQTPPALRMRKRTPRQGLASLAGWVVTLVVFASVPFWLSVDNTLLIEGMIVAAVFALATNFLVHHAGLTTFGQAVFYGIGAYTIGLFSVHTHVSFWVAVVLGPFFAALAALVIGALSLRARAFYFALLTLGFSQLFYNLSMVFYGFTRGDTGIYGIPLPGFLRSPLWSYEFIFIVGAAGGLALWWIVRTPFGLAIMAIRDNRRRAQSLGMNSYVQLLAAFVISGFFCGLAGVLFIVYQQHAYPEMLNWQSSGAPILMSVLGGMSTFAGPVVGAVIYTLLENFVGGITTYWELIIGVVVLALILIYPGGIVRGVVQLARKLGSFGNGGRGQ